VKLGARVSATPLTEGVFIPAGVSGPVRRVAGSSLRRTWRRRNVPLVRISCTLPFELWLARATPLALATAERGSARFPCWCARPWSVGPVGPGHLAGQRPAGVMNAPVPQIADGGAEVGVVDEVPCDGLEPSGGLNLVAPTAEYVDAAARSA